MGSGKTTLPPKVEKVKITTRALQLLKLKKPAPKPAPGTKPPAELSPSPNGLKIKKIPAFDEAKKSLLEKKSDRSEISQKLDIKDEKSSLEKTYKEVAQKSMKPLDGNLFIDRILLGLDCMAQCQSPDKYKNDYFLRNSWLIDRRLLFTPEDFLFAHNLGLFYEQNPKTTPFYYSALEKYLLTLTKERESATKELSSQQNLSFFMYGLNFMVTREAQRCREERQAREQEESIKRSIRLVNFEIELTFKGKELIEIALREREKDKPRMIKALIELGHFVEEVVKTVEKRSASELADVIYKLVYKKNGKIELELLRKVTAEDRLSEAKTPKALKLELAEGKLNPFEKYAIIKEVCCSKGREYIPVLLQAAVLSKLNPSLPADVKTLALYFIKETIAQTIRSTAPDLAGELVALLNYEHELTTRSKEEIAHYQVQAEIVFDIIRDLPEALPRLLEERSKHRSAIEVFASTMGIEVKKAVVRERYESLIAELIKSPAGENYVLDHVFEYLTQDEIYSNNPKAQLKALKAARLPVLEVVRQVASTAGEEVPILPFAERPKAQALRELITEIAKANDLTTDSPQRIKPKTANAMILLAVKIQQLTELVQSEKFAEARTRFEELKELNRSRKAARLEVPALDLLGTYLEASSFKKREEHSNINYLVMKSTNGNLPAALRVLEIFQEDKDIWEDLRKLAFNLSLNIFNIQYAYCFLAQRFGGEERTLENLKSILAEDKGGKHLFLTLQMLPLTIRGQAPDIYNDVFVNVDEPGHILDILVYWNLINTSGLDHRLDRQEIAKKIVEFIQKDWGDNGRLWAEILTITEAGKYHVVNEFFRRMLKNIVERARTMDLVKGKEEGATAHVLKDPFLGFKGEEYKAQIGMAIRTNEEIIHRTYKHPL